MLKAILVFLVVAMIACLGMGVYLAAHGHYFVAFGLAFVVGDILRSVLKPRVAR